MTADVVIRAEGLGKKYLIGHQSAQERYATLRDVVSRQGKSFLRKTRDMLRGGAIVAGDTTEEFWALKDINFEVRRGEVLGIVGRNGAGKSTLLKILSRITEPTTGMVEIGGRVASLLEVGTGFHPELTGRENIYLNGAILGMTRGEIRRKFDEIVAFAGVDKFLDTPVKRYSSGMYVRLAFAIAAHLEPEILVIDEVLAVGDAEFQKKCIGKISEVAGGGRTVLFVSHNMAAVESLCTTGILLDGGQITAAGKVSGILRTNLATAQPMDRTLDLTAVNMRHGQGELRFGKISIWGDAPEQPPRTGGALNLLLEFCGNRTEAKPSRVGIAISTSLGAPLIVCSTEMTCAQPPKLGAGNRQLCHIPVLPLSAESYVLTLFVEQAGVVQDWLQDACRFDVQDADFYGYGRNAPVGHEGKTVLLAHSWSTPKEAPGSSINA